MTKLLTLRGWVNRPSYEVTGDCLGQSILLGQHFQYPDKATFGSGTGQNVQNTNLEKFLPTQSGGMISQARARNTGAGPFRISSQKNSCLLNCFIAKSRTVYANASDTSYLQSDTVTRANYINSLFIPYYSVNDILSAKMHFN